MLLNVNLGNTSLNKRSNIMQKSINEYEYEDALEVLFTKMEEACKAAGLDLYTEFEDGPGPNGEPGSWAVGMWIEGGMVTILGGELTPDDRHYKKLLKWARIEKATSIAELPEGLADGDVSIREKARAKREELTDHSAVLRAAFGVR